MDFIEYIQIQKQGRIAYEQGLALGANPYSYNVWPAAAMAWAKGWRRAQADSKNSEFELEYSGEVENHMTTGDGE